MKYIYYQEDKIGVFTNQLEAQSHQHWMLQLFISLESDLDLYINNQQIKGNCIIVDKNISHIFNTHSLNHFTLIIDPTSNMGQQLQKRMNKDGYYLCNNELTDLKALANNLMNNPSIKHYIEFLKQLNNHLNLSMDLQIYDERINELLTLIDECDCDNHTLEQFSKKVYLSSSRLSHLFKEVTGIPLKSYILLHQIRKAFKLLLQGKNITEASLTAGFDSPTHFAHTVKRMMGMSTSTSLKDSVFMQVPTF